MEQAVILPFHIRTTRFGFGCSSLLGLRSARESRALVDAAFDAGIRHFDVARSYGHGESEALLAGALGSRRSQVTITSKFGIPVQRQQPWVRAARTLARPVVKRFSGLRGRSKPAASGVTQTLAFTAANARASLETTLRELRSDYLDLFLLHEATAGRLRDDGLLAFLHEAVAKGTIRGHGVGSALAAIPDLVNQRPAYCPVVQHESSLLTNDVSLSTGTYRICHGSLLRSLDRIERVTQADSVFARAMNEAAGMDVSRREKLAALLLRGAVLKHPDAITLFSARSIPRIQQNAAALTDTRLDTYCQSLAAFLAANRARLTLD